MKLIRVVSNKDGSVKIETSGFQGRECLKATADLEADLGLADHPRKLKGEYYQAATQKQSAK